MSTESGSECNIEGDFNSCPAGADFTYAGEAQTLEAFLKCPLDSVDQSGFISASQRGLCECDAALVDGDGNVMEDMECDCFACPDGSRFGFAYSCTTPIAGPCKTFDCFGNCNNPGFNPLNLDRETFGPTEAPVAPAGGSAAPCVGSATGLGMTVMVVAFFRMMM
jgi:hypothetical protein